MEFSNSHNMFVTLTERPVRRIVIEHGLTQLTLEYDLNLSTNYIQCVY